MNVPVSRAVKANHAYLKGDEPGLLASPARATGFRKICCWASVLEVYFALFASLANHQGVINIWQIRLFSCGGMITVMKVLIFSSLFSSSGYDVQNRKRFFFAVVALNCVVNHCGGFQVNAKQSGEVHRVVVNKSASDSPRSSSCQSCAQCRAIAWVFPVVVVCMSIVLLTLEVVRAGNCFHRKM